MARTYDSARGIKTTYFYDLTDRLVGYVEADIPGNFEHSVGYTYDDINNLTALVEWISGSTYTTSYTYDTDNRITSVTNGNASKSYAYDSYGRTWTLTTKHNGTTVKTDTFDFMPRGTTNQTSSQIKTHTVNIGGTDTVYTYTYDTNGNITSITGGGNTVTYAYDSANQLIREDNLAGDYTHTWTYDNAGNIVARKEYDYASAETEPSGTGETVTYTYDRTSDWGDVLRSYDDHALSYDSVGNLTDDGTWKYDWQHGRQLDKMTEKADDTKYWDYTYNADGLRTKRTNGTKTYEYIYNGSSLSQMTVDGKTLYFAYDASGTPVSVTYNGATYYYVTNIQGDVIGITDSSGNTVVTYTYDAWGKILTTSGTMTSTLGAYNPLRYRGYVYDQETGLYYLQSRYYNPEIGRFINADVFYTTDQGLLGNNMFAYCLNNPVNYSDPTGTSGHNAVQPWLCDCASCNTSTAVTYYFWQNYYWQNNSDSFWETINNHYIRQQELEIEIALQQIQLIGNGITFILQLEASRIQHEVDLKTKQDQHIRAVGLFLWKNPESLKDIIITDGGLIVSYIGYASGGSVGVVLGLIGIGLGLWGSYRLHKQIDEALEGGL